MAQLHAGMEARDPGVHEEGEARQKSQRDSDPPPHGAARHEAEDHRRSQGVALIHAERTGPQAPDILRIKRAAERRGRDQRDEGQNRLGRHDVRRSLRNV